MRKAFEIGGLVAAAVLVVFGIAAIYMGVQGRQTVQDELSNEYIIGSADMTPSQIASEVKAAGLTNVDLPTCDVANEPINTGQEARCFAQYMRIHTLESTGGYTYSQMGRFQAATDAPKAELAKGGGTDNPQYAAKDTKTGQPIANGARNLWVTETALTTALNTSYMASQIALFGIVVGVALLLTGIGFGILAIGGALRNDETAIPFIKKQPKAITT